MAFLGTAFTTLISQTLSVVINSQIEGHIEQEGIQKVIEKVGENISEEMTTKGISLAISVRDFLEKDEYKEIREQWIQDCLENIEENDLYKLTLEAFLDNNNEKFVSSCLEKCTDYINKNYLDQERC